jgi:TM2 domain-containing membrane protein YozV
VDSNAAASRFALPSFTRRIIFIALYSALGVIIVTGVFYLVVPECVDDPMMNSRCRSLNRTAGFINLAIVIAMLAAGFKGELLGARKQTIADGAAAMLPTKSAAAWLAIFLGGIGAHKFYLGQVGWGVVYLLLCWTFIPLGLGILDGIILFRMSQSDFEEKYRNVEVIV